MDNATIPTIIIAASALLAYTLKLLLPYLFRKLDEKDVWIATLTQKFTDVTNHKTTEFTGAIIKLSTSIDALVKKYDKK